MIRYCFPISYQYWKAILKFYIKKQHSQCNSSSFNRRQFFVVQILWCNWVSIFVTQSDSHLYSGQEIQLGTKKLHANWLWKIDPHFLSPKIFLPHRQESVIGVKKIHINCGSKMEVYCMNWVSLNRRLLDVQ